jgi:hypothetical protein
MFMVPEHLKTNVLIIIEPNRRRPFRAPLGGNGYLADLGIRLDDRVRIEATVIRRPGTTLAGPRVAPKTRPGEVRKVIAATANTPFEVLKAADPPADLSPWKRRAIGL